jgi:uncharacterized protein YegL
MGIPGGQMAKRPLHFIWLVDCSGSMDTDGKIQALNHAVREAIPEMVDAARSEPHAQVYLRVLAFSDGARWMVSQPTRVEEFAWNDLTAGGVTDLGAALGMTAEVLAVPPMEQRALPPVLVLISDGQPTDDFQRGLDRLLAEPWGQKAVRVAIAIGRDADHDVLARFIGNSEIKPLQAGSPEQLVRYVRWASTLVKPVSQPRRDDTGERLVIKPPDPPQTVRAPDLDITW